VKGNKPVRYKRRVHIMRVKVTSSPDMESQIEKQIDILSRLANDEVMAQAYVSHVCPLGPSEILVMIEWHQPIYAD
jgi:hypothetical protein